MEDYLSDMDETTDSSVSSKSPVHVTNFVAQVRSSKTLTDNPEPKRRIPLTSSCPSKAPTKPFSCSASQPYELKGHLRTQKAIANVEKAIMERKQRRRERGNLYKTKLHLKGKKFNNASGTLFFSIYDRSIKSINNNNDLKVVCKPDNAYDLSLLSNAMALDPDFVKRNEKIIKFTSVYRNISNRPNELYFCIKHMPVTIDVVYNHAVDKVQALKTTKNTPDAMHVKFMTELVELMPKHRIVAQYTIFTMLVANSQTTLGVDDWKSRADAHRCIHMIKNDVIMLQCDRTGLVKETFDDVQKCKDRLMTKYGAFTQCKHTFTDVFKVEVNPGSNKRSSQTPVETFHQCSKVGKTSGKPEKLKGEAASFVREDRKEDTGPPLEDFDDRPEVPLSALESPAYIEISEPENLDDHVTLETEPISDVELEPVHKLVSPEPVLQPASPELAAPHVVSSEPEPQHGSLDPASPAPQPASPEPATQPEPTESEQQPASTEPEQVELVRSISQAFEPVSDAEECEEPNHSGKTTVKKMDVLYEFESKHVEMSVADCLRQDVFCSEIFQGSFPRLDVLDIASIDMTHLQAAVGFMSQLCVPTATLSAETTTEVVPQNESTSCLPLNQSAASHLLLLEEEIKRVSDLGKTDSSNLDYIHQPKSLAVSPEHELSAKEQTMLETDMDVDMQSVPISSTAIGLPAVSSPKETTANHDEPATTEEHADVDIQNVTALPEQNVLSLPAFTNSHASESSSSSSSSDDESDSEEDCDVDSNRTVTTETCLDETFHDSQDDGQKSVVFESETAFFRTEREFEFTATVICNHAYSVGANIPCAITSANATAVATGPALNVKLECLYYCENTMRDLNACFSVPNKYNYKDGSVAPICVYKLSSFATVTATGIANVTLKMLYKLE